MFNNLVESGSHAADLKRRGRYFAAALAFYGLLLTAAGVGSVYAFNAHLDAQSDYEVYAILRFQPPAEPSEPARAEAPRPAAGPSRTQQLTTRREISVNTPYHGDRIASESARDVKANARVVVAPFDSDPEPGGDILPGPGEGFSRRRSNDDGATGPRVEAGTPPPPPATPRTTATPAPTPRQGPVSLSTLISSKIISKPVPPYPPAAKAARVQGSVTVNILVDERGNVVTASASSGNPLLQYAAVQAARQARFTPTVLNGQPVKVTGVITYNFTLQ